MRTYKKIAISLSLLLVSQIALSAIICPSVQEIKDPKNWTGEGYFSYVNGWKANQTQETTINMIKGFQEAGWGNYAGGVGACSYNDYISFQRDNAPKPIEGDGKWKRVDWSTAFYTCKSTEVLDCPF